VEEKIERERENGWG
jgi:hypothetical protein